MGDLGHEDDEADDETYRPGRGSGALASHDSYDDTGALRQGGRGRGRGRGRGGPFGGGRGRGGRGRGRKTELDAMDDGSGQLVGLGSGGMGGYPGQAGSIGGAGAANGIGGAANGGMYGHGAGGADGERPNKRRRRGYDDAGGAGTGGGGGAGAGGGAGGGSMDAAAQARVREVLLREVARMEAVKKAISDPGSMEHAVAARSYRRLKEVAAELEVQHDAAAAISDMACQVGPDSQEPRGNDHPLLLPLRKRPSRHFPLSPVPVQEAFCSGLKLGSCSPYPPDA